MKVVNIQCTFRQLKGGNAYQAGRGKGSNVKVATARAFADMYKRLRKSTRARFTEFTATVQVRDMEQGQEELSV